MATSTYNPWIGLSDEKLREIKHRMQFCDPDEEAEDHFNGKVFPLDHIPEGSY